MKEGLPRQYTKEPSAADIAIVAALLDEKTAKRYKGASEKRDNTTQSPDTYTPTAAELAAVQQAREANKEFEKNAENTKKSWMAWADKFKIDRNYIEKNAIFQKNGDVIWDGVCDIDGHELTEFPPNFIEVTGSLYIINNKFRNLEGAPKKIGGDFNCSENKLKNLQGAPQEIKKRLLCIGNPELTEGIDGINVGEKVWVSDDQKSLKEDLKRRGYDVHTYYY